MSTLIARFRHLLVNNRSVVINRGRYNLDIKVNNLDSVVKLKIYPLFKVLNFRDLHFHEYITGDKYILSLNDKELLNTHKELADIHNIHIDLWTQIDVSGDKFN
jgi:hypothetical protein